MIPVHDFIFLNSNKEWRESSSDLVARVGKGVTKEADLFEDFSSQLKFPEYFGRNWHALFDMLCDLGWVQSECVRIQFDDLPFRNEPRVLYVLLSVMSDALSRWKEDEYAVQVFDDGRLTRAKKRFFVAFPEEYRSLISDVTSRDLPPATQ